MVRTPMLLTARGMTLPLSLRQSLPTHGTIRLLLSPSARPPHSVAPGMPTKVPPATGLPRSLNQLPLPPPLGDDPVDVGDSEGRGRSV